jgi:AcrR family transcriptional regulator
MASRPVRANSRKKPQQERSIAMVATLLEAATRVFVKEGYAKATTNRIAAAAGVSVGSLYQYFPSKEAIVVAMVRRQRERVMREIAALMERAARGECTPEEVVRLYVRRLIDAFGRGRSVQRVLARLGWKFDAHELIAQTMDEGSAGVQALIVQLDDPRWPPPDAPTMYALARGLTWAIRSATIEDNPVTDDPRFEEALVRMVTGLLHRPQRGDSATS